MKQIDFTDKEFNLVIAALEHLIFHYECHEEPEFQEQVNETQAIIDRLT